jgi:hypothetical protein
VRIMPVTHHAHHCSPSVPPCSFLFDIVANKRNSIDVDKFDYLQRDAMCSGVMTSCDFGRLMAYSQVRLMADDCGCWLLVPGCARGSPDACCCLAASHQCLRVHSSHIPSEPSALTATSP